MAIATAAGFAERGIVRMSGPEAAACATALFEPEEDRPRQQFPGGWARGGMLLKPEWAKGARGRAYFWRAPRSYTGEDVCELHLPGWPGLLSQVLEAALAWGARAAAPGEFTRRAFLFGRLDLAQAEAVLSLVRARSAAEARAAAAVVVGKLGGEIEALAGQIDQLRAEVEATLDFAEENLETLVAEDAREQVAALRERLLAAASLVADDAQTLGAPSVALAGPTNAGKSTLFNCLLRLAGAEAPPAITASSPHTTRDVLVARCDLSRAAGQKAPPPGVLPARAEVMLCDLAGFERAGGGDVLARLGQAQAREVLAGAELVLWLSPADAPSLPGAGELPEGATPLIVTSKSDLCRGAPAPGEWRVSAKTGEGLPRLLVEMQRRLGADASVRAPEALAFSARARAALLAAATGLERATEQLCRPLPAYELLAVDLRAARGALAEALARPLVPEELTESALEAVFSRFCLGK